MNFPLRNKSELESVILTSSKIFLLFQNLFIILDKKVSQIIIKQWSKEDIYI